MTEEKFNKYFSAFILVGMTVTVVLATVLKFEILSQGGWLLIVSAFGSLMGVIATVLSANGIVWNFLFGFLDVAIYGVMCYIGSKYGNAVLHFVYFVPMQFIGFWQWRHRGAEGTTKVKARRLTAKSRWGLAAALVVATVVSYLILLRFDKSTADSFIRYAVLADAMAVCFNVAGQWLMSMAYMEQWILWIGVNVSSLVMWGLTLGETGETFAVIYLVKYSFYLLNSLNGLRLWLK